MILKRHGPLEVGFRPEDGGRLALLRYQGVDLVLPPDRVAGFYGDTFWPSPQSLFDWPPPSVLDAEPYEVLVDSPTALVMRSAPDPEYGLQVRKRFALTDDAVSIDFTVWNTWDRPHAIAPWQITRTPRDGLLVWAPGEPFTDDDRLRKEAEDPGCWYVHSASPRVLPELTRWHELAVIAASDVPRKCKLFTDAHGWLAHVHDATLFLRTFPDLTSEQMAPRQAELELFFDPERDYLELENQGPFQELASGGRLDYAVQWRFTGLDAHVPADRVTPGLVDQIQRLLAVSPPSNGTSCG